MPIPPSRLLVVAGLVIAGTVGVTMAIRFLRPAHTDLPPPLPRTASTLVANTPSLRYLAESIGLPVTPNERPMVTQLRIMDLDQDGLPDVVYAEAATDRIRWIRQSPRGNFTDTPIGDPVRGPVSIWPADINGNGRLDVLVGSMGQVFPTNDRIGSVVVLENEDNTRFRNRVLLSDTARVTDVRAANLSDHADGKLDLVVGQFGYAQGEIRWMHNLGDWRFESHTVNRLSGTVHTPIADFDGDRRPDFAAIISQEWEEVHLFRNLGQAQFQESILWGSTNEDYGSSGMEVTDLDRDGRPDLLVTNGDGFDYPIPGGRPWHGVQWLRNQGDGRFTFRRIGDMVGAYSARAADLDGDGDLDLVAVSCFADWSDPKAISLQAWINDGGERFTPVVLAHHPTHLVTADVGDLDGDGIPEIVTGGMYAFPPYTDPSRITLWRRQ